ncbi:hypothetical protein N1028_19470 [Herbiconiux sp. CPCC 203407]|uniref:SMI1/KNR4 family protein n=1 Tax=Herbiconiux oxytropis TaxID=2970915 RepID=A0AA41XJS7_9MICO|nr:hypothetical protein [Herbiconiux oxytropis]MCS5723675.1 hypothetical protein [Herbiconiux oxytropis]MCS5728084.1 hypothetical protein [Herbiconiux oxytropis]
MTSAFTTAVRDSLPARLVLPPEWVTTFDWLQAQGHVAELHGGPLAGVHRVSDDASSEVGFHPAEPDFMKFWLGNEDVDDEIAVVVRTGGDGSHAALWLDPGGVQRIVHLGSGSGSTAIGILVENPVDLLRLMAIGYEELCWPENYELTPAEASAAERNGDDEDPDVRRFTPPRSFQAFVRHTFEVSIPERACEIVGDLVDMDDGPGASTDPFAAWLEQNRR